MFCFFRYRGIFLVQGRKDFLAAPSSPFRVKPWSLDYVCYMPVTGAEGMTGQISSSATACYKPTYTAVRSCTSFLPFGATCIC